MRQRASARSLETFNRSAIGLLVITMATQPTLFVARNTANHFGTTRGSWFLVSTLPPLMGTLEEDSLNSNTSLHEAFVQGNIFLATRRFIHLHSWFETKHTAFATQSEVQLNVVCSVKGMES